MAQDDAVSAHLALGLVQCLTAALLDNKIVEAQSLIVHLKKFAEASKHGGPANQAAARYVENMIGELERRYSKRPH